MTVERKAWPPGGDTGVWRGLWRRARRGAWWRLLAATLCCLLFTTLLPTGVYAATPDDDIVRRVGFDQRLDAQAPLDLAFRDEAGRQVRLGDYFRGKPVILTLNYYACPNLCNLVLLGLTTSLREVEFDIGNQFDVVTVSIDPSETPPAAAAKKAELLARYDRPGAAAGWHFLTGEEASIQRLAGAVGFRYAYDTRQGQYAHPSGVLILTPQGRVASYFYGVQYAPRDLRLGLVEASANRIGSPVDQLLLLCYHYDPVTGRYTGLVMNLLRAAGLTTVLTIGALVVVQSRRRRVE